MGRIEKSIEIRAPPEKVWEMLAFDRCPEWMKGLKSVEYVSDVRTPKDKYRVGASAHAIKVEQEEFDFEITESLENEKITARTTPIHGAPMTISFILKPTEVGTEMTYGRFELPSLDYFLRIHKYRITRRPRLSLVLWAH